MPRAVRGRALKARQKKMLVGGSLALLTLGWVMRSGKGRVELGPVTVTNVPGPKLSKADEAAVQRFALARKRLEQLLGYDPNTLVTRQPSPADEAFALETIALGDQLSAATNGAVPAPSVERQMLALARKLPGDAMAKVNSDFYALLGINPKGTNEPTLPLTPAREAAARALIAKWRPYSENATGALYAQVDFARELGGVA